MNVTTIAGNLGKDAENRKTKTGKTITSFSVAVKSGKETVWFDCASMHHENLAQYLLKGTPVTISGRMSFKKVEDGKGYWPTLWVNDITLQGRKEQSATINDGTMQSGGNEDFDSQIPFAKHFIG